MPLQELISKHLPDSPADTVLIGAMANMVAAAAAKATPEIFFAVFIYSTLSLKKIWFVVRVLNFTIIYAGLESVYFKLVQKFQDYLAIK